jgi:hypothetical protein
MKDVSWTFPGFLYTGLQLVCRMKTSNTDGGNDSIMREKMESERPMLKGSRMNHPSYLVVSSNMTDNTRYGFGFAYPKVVVWVNSRKIYWKVDEFGGCENMSGFA